jgi:glucosyl-dolichyl phosphate glucuronosyltransferase
MPDFSVVIVTRNRAALLRDTLAAIAALRTPDRFDLIVADNGSEDGTRTVVDSFRGSAAVPVQYLWEPHGGKYHALNKAILSARGRYIAATDDDAFPAAGWLEAAAGAFERLGCDFVGGPVLPVWRGERPPWLIEGNSLTGKVLALQDYGSAAREYGCGIGWPLGVNVAYARDVFDRAGLFDPSLGRTAGTLRSQAQREWHLRARATGARGFYVPGMVVHHVVAPDRLTKRYFRRWFYWHGVSRAILYQKTGCNILDPEEGAGHDGERHVCGVPASIWRTAAASCASLARRAITGDATAFEYDLCAWMCAGVIRQRWRDRRLPAAGRKGGLPVPLTTS